MITVETMPICLTCVLCYRQSHGSATVFLAHRLLLVLAQIKPH